MRGFVEGKDVGCGGGECGVEKIAGGGVGGNLGLCDDVVQDGRFRLPGLVGHVGTLNFAAELDKSQ